MTLVAFVIGLMVIAAFAVLHAALILKAYDVHARTLGSLAILYSFLVLSWGCLNFASYYNFTRGVFIGCLLVLGILILVRLIKVSFIAASPATHAPHRRHTHIPVEKDYA